MDSIEKKLGQLSPELRNQVEDFVDFLILKYEKQPKKEESATKSETKKELKVIKTEKEEINAPVEPETPPTPPPIKRSMAFTRVEMMGNSQYTSSISQKTNTSNPSHAESTPYPQKSPPIQQNPASSEQKAIENKNPTSLNTGQPGTPTKEANQPKSEMLGEREIEVERQLFPCPYCSNVVQDNWDECPFCNKPLKKQAGPPPVAKKKWFK